MKHICIFIAITFFQLNLLAQKEFHIFPANDKSNPGKSIGIGSLENPWDLQTGLNQKPQVVNGGDIIWLHEGVYKGHFISSLKSTIANKFITVAAFKKDKVILNGNHTSVRKNVLQVKGERVIFKDFEITCKGEFSRNENDVNFKRINGLDHASGEDCKFINLSIYNNPGLGFGSWRNTGGTIIENCKIYNNGYISKNGKGTAEGMYVQNNSEKTRIIRNNIIFNNYYKGIEVWSANKKAKREYVKNVLIENNVIFNNGSPSGVFYDNLIIATDDRNGINIAKNISVMNNIFYHNTNVLNNEVNGYGASLTLGFHPNAPVENIRVQRNIIIGRNNALRILYAKSLFFENNITYSGYVHIDKSVLKHMKSNSWKFNKNEFYSKNLTPFRIIGNKKYSFLDWKTKFNLDKSSQSKHLRDFNINNILDISKIDEKLNIYRVVTFNKLGDDVTIDFSKYNIPSGSNYKIYDVENNKSILKSGIISNDYKIMFPMNNLAFEKPLHNDRAQKTLSNFGVFIIEFDKVEKPKRKSFFGRIFSSIFG